MHLQTILQMTLRDSDVQLLTEQIQLLKNLGNNLQGREDAVEYEEQFQEAGH